MVFLIICVVILFTALTFYTRPLEAKYVRIYVDNEEYAVFTLDQPYPKTIAIQSGTHYAHLRIENHEVFMIDSTCENLDCVKMGAIRHAGDMIVCLPLRIVVRLEGGDAVDAVSY